jgi:hypothetical protein
MKRRFTSARSNASEKKGGVGQGRHPADLNTLPAPSLIPPPKKTLLAELRLFYRERGWQAFRELLISRLRKEGC